MHRVRLSRVGGWKMPPDCRKVARPGRWGNPWVAVQHPATGSWYAKRKDRPFNPRWAFFTREEAVRHCVRLFARYAAFRAARDPAWIEPLRGKSLACFCNLEDECHGDVLLRLAADLPPAG